MHTITRYHRAVLIWRIETVFTMESSSRAAGKPHLKLSKTVTTGNRYAQQTHQLTKNIILARRHNKTFQICELNQMLDRITRFGKPELLAK